MKVAISCTEDKIESPIDQRFGRCAYFLIVDIEDKKIKNVKAVENQGAIQGHGAGIKAGQQLGDEGVEAVITGNLGPNATNVLDQLGIKAYHASGPAKEALDEFIKGKLGEIAEIAQPHSGMTQQKQEKSERIFFPLLEDKGMDSEISGHFGHAPFFGIYDTGTKEFKIIENKLEHTDPNKSPVDQVVEIANPTTVFAQGIGGRAIGLFAEKGITLKTGPYNTVKEVIENLDKLEDLNQSCGH
ncbi:hypothetical protein KY361_02685 [Candidatus Woesearchaeota archaeon]|nr:hypothetical protein [Candidatus Woesearchaeota archaeon]